MESWEKEYQYLRACLQFGTQERRLLLFTIAMEVCCIAPIEGTAHGAPTTIDRIQELLLWFPAYKKGYTTQMMRLPDKKRRTTC